MTATSDGTTPTAIYGDCDDLLGRCLVIALAMRPPGEAGESSTVARLFEAMIALPWPGDQKLLFLGDVLQLRDEDGVMIANIVEQARSEQERP